MRLDFLYFIFLREPILPLFIGIRNCEEDRNSKGSFVGREKEKEIVA